MDLGATRVAPVSAPAVETPQPVSPQDLAERRDLVKAVRALNETRSFGQNNELTFTLDRSTRRTVVRIVNRDTREVVQQIPSEEVLRLAESLNREQGATRE